MTCEEITVRREWCRNAPRPGQTRCTEHVDGPAFDATADDYRHADAVEHDREMNRGT
ncbi:hypothetical protein [Actinomadura rudentiformis]|uniref:hypothetical protein n=1 Tax=Actinomadura rudentiformis TaxID=359158 RepID=UPI00178C4EC0|nr:hypothetical protein [Actinomadura rudentiformis]